MNFEFSDEQNMLREQAQTFLRAECPPQAVRQVLDGATTRQTKSEEIEVWPMLLNRRAHAAFSSRSTPKID